jgi:hypothetical protein
VSRSLSTVRAAAVAVSTSLGDCWPMVQARIEKTRTAPIKRNFFANIARLLLLSRKRYLKSYLTTSQGW